MFVYWFRYSLLMLLRNLPGKALSRRTARENQLAYVGLADQIGTAPDPEIFDSLDHDYQVLRYLLRHTGGDYRVRAFEEYLLRADYALLRAYYRAVRRAWPPGVKPALREMAAVLGCLGHIHGERLELTRARS